MSRRRARGRDGVPEAVALHLLLGLTVGMTHIRLPTHSLRLKPHVLGCVAVSLPCLVSATGSS